MELGQMLFRENFGLFEAMSALEVFIGETLYSETLQQMMDPKMDGGMSGVSVSYSLDEKIEMGILPDDSKFSIPELLSIMDYLLACEVSSSCGRHAYKSSKITWLHGEPSIQTIFSCIYTQRISLISNPYLDIYCKLMLKTDALIRNSIIRGDIYEVISKIAVLDLIAPCSGRRLSFALLRSSLPGEHE
jgi:hypothetical protein